MTGFRSAPSAGAIARNLPDAEEARIRAILAAAGGDLPQALAALSAALGVLVVERVHAELHPLVLSAAARRVAETAVLRAPRASGSC